MITNRKKIIAADQYEDSRGGFHVLILTEYCSGGSLNDRLSQPSSEEKTLKWLSQIASALSYLHLLQIVHRDFKLHNVMLTGSTREDLKLGDFGSARKFLALKRVKTLSASNCGLAQYYMQSGIGPAHWMLLRFPLVTIRRKQTSFPSVFYSTQSLYKTSLTRLMRGDGTAHS